MRTALSLACIATLAILPAVSFADLVLAPDTKIVFGDATTLSTAPAPGGEVPDGHGGVNNTVSGANAFVGGGDTNIASGSESVVNGGEANVANSSHSTVGGGFDNQAGAGTAATVGGGTTNTASGTNSTVGGGELNSATGFRATIAGGVNNFVSGSNGTVPGGSNNSVTADNGFAAGRRAKSNHESAIIFADSKDVDFVSIAPFEFAVRATGGVRFVTAITTGNPSAGVELEPGDNSWSTLSARDSKENFADIDSVAILDKLAGLSIQQWNYKSNDDAIKHIGPIAEEFHAAFGLGGEYTGRISTQDFDGVALSAIQGLNAKLEAEVVELRQRLSELEAKLAASAER